MPNQLNNISDVANAKSLMRKKFMHERDSLTSEYRAHASEDIAKQLFATVEYERAEIVFAYVSFKSEVDTHALIEQMFADNKRVAVPKCVPHTREMRWYEIRSLADLQLGAYGILEPACDPQVLVVPPTRDLRPPVLESVDKSQTLIVPPVGDVYTSASRSACDSHVQGAVHPCSTPATHPPAMALIPGAAFDSRGHRLGYGGGYYDTFLQNFAGTSIGLCFRECFSSALFCIEPHDVPVDLVLRNVNSAFA